MVIFYKKWEKYNKIQITEYKTDLNNRKMKKINPPAIKKINEHC